MNQPRRLPGMAWIALTLMLVLLAMRLVHSAVILPPTFDEYKHSQTGYVFLATGQCCLGQSDTAMTAIHGWPWVIRDRAPWPPRVAPGSSPERLQPDDRYPAIHRLNTEARYATVLMSMILAVLVFLLAREYGGVVGGLSALALYVVSPNLSAHGCLVSTDFHGAFGIFVATSLTIFGVKKGMGLRTAILPGLGFTVALVSKYTALGLLGAIPLIAALAWWRGRSGEVRQESWRSTLAFIAATISLGFLGVLIVYELPKLTGGLGIIDADKNPFLNREVWHEELRGYLGGLTLPRAMARTGVDNYFRGEFGTTWASLYPTLLFLKTPLGLLSLAIFGFFGLFRNRDGILGWGAVVATPAALFLASCASKVTFALRYILPVWPFLMVLGGIGAFWLWSRGKVGRTLALLLLGWASFDGLRSHPFSLAYTNNFLEEGLETAEWFADSNVDWGQGLIALAEEVKERGIEEIAVSIHGSISPELYGLTRIRREGTIAMTKELPPYPEEGSEGPPIRGWIAVSLTHFVGMYYPSSPHCDPQAFLWLRKYAPIKVIGGSILLYHIPDDG